MITRRNFLIAAPAVVAATSLMPVKLIDWNYATVRSTVPGTGPASIWVDPWVKNNGTDVFVDGLLDNPVRTIASAKEIARQLDLSDAHIVVMPHV